jgi:hypothetical protein
MLDRSIHDNCALRRDPEVGKSRAHFNRCGGSPICARLKHKLLVILS